MSGPYLGLDIGLKRTGTAFSESGLQARPLIVLESAYPHLEPLYTGVLTLCQEYAPTTLVVGRPDHANGTSSQQGERVEQIAAELQNRLPAVNIIFWDEHGTTKASHRLYPSLDDNLGAATIILQEYLDSI